MQGFPFSQRRKFWDYSAGSFCGRPPRHRLWTGGVLESIISDKTGLFFEQQNIDSLIPAFDDLETAEDQHGLQNG